MKKLIKLGVIASIVLILAVAASGCVSTPTTTPMASATPAPTTTPVAKATVAPTAKPTATPKPAESTAVDSDVAAVINGMESKGYVITTPTAYQSTDSHGDRIFSVTFDKGAYTFDTTVSKSLSYSNGVTDYNSRVAAAKADGYTGSLSDLEGYTYWWTGTKYVGGQLTMIAVGLVDSNGWVLQMIET